MSELIESEVMAWIESAVGAKVVKHERQAREYGGGRPAWFVTCQNGGGSTRYYIRGNRGPSFEYNSVYSLVREARGPSAIHLAHCPRRQTRHVHLSPLRTAQARRPRASRGCRAPRRPPSERN